MFLAARRDQGALVTVQVQLGVQVGALRERIGRAQQQQVPLPGRADANTTADAAVNAVPNIVLATPIENLYFICNFTFRSVR